MLFKTALLFSVFLWNEYVNTAFFSLKKLTRNQHLLPFSCQFVMEKFRKCFHHTHLKVILTYKNAFHWYRKKLENNYEICWIYFPAKQFTFITADLKTKQIISSCHNFKMSVRCISSCSRIINMVNSSTNMPLTII